ncbi:MAG: FtsX-like permease family protein [Oscillibacter sp.]|nr:FtsX-like permease family protein [Oscillibacter sp.]
MRKSGFFPRLALVNLVRNGRFYGPYLLSCAATAAMYYILQFLGRNEGLDNVRGAVYLKSFASIGCFVAALLAAVMLLYANSFVMKRRQRELGLYNVLGLEKRHIAQMCFWETLLCAVIGITGGVAMGVLLSKAMLLLLLKIARMSVQFGMEVSWEGILHTVQLFGVLFLLTLIVNLYRVSKSKPVELLHSAQAGEREPRTKWLLVVLGTLTLGAGYVLAAVTQNPIEAMLLFFVAVILVVIGTYCLFTSGSIAVLKRLRANPKFYYQTRHFTAVSGLLYRMKQNAVGLASICILSTMVLVTISTTICLNIGLENSLNTMFPYDLEFIQNLDQQPEDSMEYLAQIQQEASDLGVDSDMRYYTRYTAYCGLRNNEISLCLDEDCTQVQVEIVTAADYGRITGKDVILAPDEVLAYLDLLDDFPADFTIAARLGETGLPFHIRDTLTDYIRHGSTILITEDTPLLFLVVSDQAAAERITALDPSRSTRQFRVQMNLKGTYEQKMAQTEELISRLSCLEDGISFTGKQDNAVDFYAMYGGFLFLGVFLGGLFLLATVLIMYYKQISEGYEDQRRYQIMRQVGMTEREVQGSIHSQILLVFFLPLGAAAIHSLAAFPMLSRMLRLFQINNVGLFAACCGGTILVFCVIYALVFLLTARTYGRIVGTSERR